MFKTVTLWCECEKFRTETHVIARPLHHASSNEDQWKLLILKVKPWVQINLPQTFSGQTWTGPKRLHSHNKETGTTKLSAGSKTRPNPQRLISDLSAAHLASVHPTKNRWLKTDPFPEMFSRFDRQFLVKSTENAQSDIYSFFGFQIQLLTRNSECVFTAWAELQEISSDISGYKTPSVQSFVLVSQHVKLDFIEWVN